MSYKYSCSLVELDDIMTPNLYTDKELGAIPIVLKFFKENEFAKTHRHEKKCYELAEEFINYLMNNESDDKLIVEGVQIWLSINSKDNIINYDKIISFPIIFKGTAGLLSTFRALRRDRYKRTVYKIMHKYTYIFSDNMKIEKLRKMTKMAMSKCDNMSNEGAVYASSIGMFGDSEENNEEPYTISTISFNYLMKEVSTESIKYNEDIEYIFIRNVKGVYKNKLSPTNILDKGIRLVDKRSKDKAFYNHSTINTTLNDNFVGLTLDNDKRSVKRESIVHTEFTKYTNGCDQNLSTYTIFAIPVTKNERQEIEKMLNNAINNPNINYSVITNFLIGLKLIHNKLHQDTSIESHQFNDTNLVCSTFIAYILTKCSSKIKNIFDKKNIDYSRITPNGLTNAIPDCKKLFSGVWKDYDNDLQKYLKKHPELAKYHK